MSTAMPAFDTYKYIRTLRDAGFTEAQAEAQASALIQAQDAHLERLATKDDIAREIARVEAALSLVETRLNGRMDRLGAELRGEMGVLRTEVRQLKWLSGPVALVAIVWIAKEALKVFGVAS